MVTNDGFDWLYGEEADGSVVHEPPAIGAVTEPGSPGATAPEPPASYPAEAPEAPEITAEAPEAPEFSTEAPEFSAGVVEAPEFAEVAEEPATVDSFDSFDDFEQPEAAVVQPPAPPAPPAPPTPVTPPAPPAPIEAPVEAAANEAPVTETVDEFDFDFGELDASFDSSPIAQVAEPQTTEPTPPQRIEEETAVMDAVASGATAEIPVLSSRGDIIPAGPRKLGLREKLKPAPRAPKAARPKTVDTKQAASSSASSGGAKKAIVSVVILAISVASVVWRSEGLKKMIFGNGAPSEAQVDAAFTPLNGYPYIEPPAGLMDQMNQMSETFLPAEIEHYDMRLLGSAEKPQGMVMIFSVDPDLATPEHWRVEAEMMAGDPSLGKMKETRIGGVDAMVAEAPAPMNSSMIVFADPDGLYFAAIGPNARASEDIVQQLAKANS